MNESAAKSTPAHALGRACGALELPLPLALPYAIACAVGHTEVHVRSPSAPLPADFFDGLPGRTPAALMRLIRERTGATIDYAFAWRSSLPAELGLLHEASFAVALYRALQKRGALPETDTAMSAATTNDARLGANSSTSAGDVSAPLGRGLHPLGLLVDAMRAAGSKRPETHRIAAILYGRDNFCWRHFPPAVTFARNEVLHAALLAPPTKAHLAKPDAIQRALTAELPFRRAASEAARSARWLLALDRGDANQLRSDSAEDVVAQRVGPLIPGFFPARSAAIEAGGLGFGVTAGAECFVATAMDSLTATRAAEAARVALLAHRVEVEHYAATRPTNRRGE